MTDVLDLSHWNTVTDWPALHADGILGVIHKRSQGTDFADPAFDTRRQQAADAGISLWGRYHFGTAEDVPGQVANFLADWTPDEAMALDWEDYPPSQMSFSEADEFVHSVYDQTGVLPVIYSGHNLKEAMLANPNYNGILLNCRLWLAQYGPGAILPMGFDHYWLWQFTGSGRIPGTASPTDLNRSMFDGDPGELAASWASPQEWKWNPPEP